MKEKTVLELKEMMDRKEDFQLIDVREQYESEISNLGGELIPLGTIVQEEEKIDKSKPVIIYCRSGSRSAAAVNQLEKQFGFTNLYNLKGGILAYADLVDPSLTKY
ncbi:MAG: rhodanese-like domain-containing protein [Bacteroidia bacterium]